MNDIFEQVEKNIDNLVVNQADWTASATKEELDAARGKIDITFFRQDSSERMVNEYQGKESSMPGWSRRFAGTTSCMCRCKGYSD